MIVLSCVGSSAFKVVSCASAVAPSNTIPFAPIFIPDVDVPEAKVNVLIVGLVKVLFVSVSDPVSEAKLSSVNALLNCAKVPEIVFDPNAMVLFVKVSVVSANIIVPLAFGKVCVLSAVGSAKLKVVSKESSVDRKSVV